MKSEWTTYFKSLGMSSVLVQRATQACEAFSTICPDDIQDLVVSEYINQDGIREFEDLFLFTPRHIVRVTRFAVQDILDADATLPLGNLLIERTDFDFKQANDKSRLHVRYATMAHFVADLKASGQNCMALTRILRERLVPLLRPQPSNPADD
jgi:hypothetical protein